jgi:membrane protease YdiL (CAAX protease family)
VTDRRGVDVPSVRTPAAETSRALPFHVAGAWLVVAFAAGIVVPVVLGASVPLFALAMIAIAGGALRRTRSAATIGLSVGAPRRFLGTTVVATVVITAVFGLAEVVWHPYRELLALVADANTPDSTFAWVVSGRHHLVAFALYAGLVTMFAEEVVFRGLLLARLRHRGPLIAIGATTLAFAVLQAIAALQLGVGAAFGFLFLDAIVAVGVVGGAAAWFSRSILPGLIALTVANAVVVASVI